MLAEIKGRELSPGDRLPGDHELCKTYEVSRTVVRQALSELEEEGIIERVKGRGTFLAPQRTPQGLVQSLTGLFEDVAARGSHLRSEVRRLETVPADHQIAAELEVALGSKVILIERLRIVDDEPWVLVISHYPYDLVPGLLEEDLADQSLYQLLEGKYGIILAGGRRSVEASVANQSLARTLGIHRGKPVLVLRSLVFEQSGRPVETFVSYNRGDRSAFEVLVKRNQSAVTTVPMMRVIA
jgi:GntR family transcriptional regulator